MSKRTSGAAGSRLVQATSPRPGVPQAEKTVPPANTPAMPMAAETAPPAAELSDTGPGDTLQTVPDAGAVAVDISPLAGWAPAIAEQ